MTPLDGNAIAGTLNDVFGDAMTPGRSTDLVDDMTLAAAACAHCGQAGLLADLVVYVGGPGIVGRCRSCESLLLVITERRGRYCVDVAGLSYLSPPSALP